LAGRKIGWDIPDVKSKEGPGEDAGRKRKGATFSRIFDSGKIDV